MLVHLIHFTEFEATHIDDRVESGLAIFTVTGLWTAGELRWVRTFFLQNPSHFAGGITPMGDVPVCWRG